MGFRSFRLVYHRGDSLQFFIILFTPRLQSHGRFVGRDRGRTPPRLAQTRRRSPRVGPAWGRTDSLIRHAPGPDWSRNCSTGAWNCQTRRLGRSWNGSPRWYDAPAVTSFERQPEHRLIHFVSNFPPPRIYNNPLLGSSPSRKRFSLKNR